MLYFFIAIFMFGVLIAIHELGHFTAAKLLGVRVNEFAIGMGPRLLHKKGGETEYSLRLFPIGGFCAMEGEDEASDDPRAFGRQRAWKKVVILVAGSLMNFLLGALIVLFLYAQSKAFTLPVVDHFMEGFPLQAEQWLMPGDRILAVNGTRVLTAANIGELLDRGGEGAVDLVIVRDGVRLERNGLPLEKREYVSDGEVGLYYGFRFQQVEATPWLAVRESWYATLDFVRMVWTGLLDLVTGAVGIRDMSGPIGIVSMITEVGVEAQEAAGVSVAINRILLFMALIAVNLAVMNMLPLPALDGGRIFLMAVGGIFTLITHKKLDPKYEGYVHAAGFIALIALMVVVALGDILRLVQT